MYYSIFCPLFCFFFHYFRYAQTLCEVAMEFWDIICYVFTIVLVIQAVRLAMADADLNLLFWQYFGKKPGEVVIKGPELLCMHVRPEEFVYKLRFLPSTPFLFAEIRC